jgi:hypothetical protein
MEVGKFMIALSKPLIPKLRPLNGSSTWVLHIRLAAFDYLKSLDGI